MDQGLYKYIGTRRPHWLGELVKIVKLDNNLVEFKFDDGSVGKMSNAKFIRDFKSVDESFVGEAQPKILVTTLEDKKTKLRRAVITFERELKNYAGVGHNLLKYSQKQGYNVNKNKNDYTIGFDNHTFCRLSIGFNFLYFRERSVKHLQTAPDNIRRDFYSHSFSLSRGFDQLASILDSVYKFEKGFKNGKGR